MYINSIYIKFREIKMTFTYSEASCTWLKNHLKMTPKYIACLEEKFNTWLREFMVRNNCSMRVIEHSVGIQELFREFMIYYTNLDDVYAKIGLLKKQRLIDDSGEYVYVYDLSYRVSEEDDYAKMTPEDVMCLEAKLREFMVRKNFSMRFIKRRIEELFEVFMNHQGQLDEICEDIGFVKQDLIDSGEDVYDLSYREN